jgi:hypothetical protein
VARFQMAVNRKLTKDRWNLDPVLERKTNFEQQSHLKHFWNDSQQCYGVLDSMNSGSNIGKLVGFKRNGSAANAGGNAHRRGKNVVRQ